MTGRPEDTPTTGALVRPFLADPEAPPLAGPPVAQAPVRPFLLTAGRTAPADEYPVETQIVITRRGERAVETLTFEYRDIVAICTEPVAVAEIAAQLGLHLGVIRVLVADLQQQGMVTTHHPETAPADDVDVIQRVIHGLRHRG
ncbi:MAG TPA: DUF742 domain-containing protein [Kineosporiaceae bacterium]